MGTAPDVGVPEDLATFYFAQMAAGIVSLTSAAVLRG